ncbi:MAG: hypothetical protein JO006_16925 [Paucibacter sp.]|nr:hypothetical protein [Roseateles sp.]
MFPIALLVSALAKNPDLAASAVQTATKPGAVDVAKMQGSLVDLSKGILKCYHHTANFQQTDIVGSPWDRAWQYGAERSAVLRIRFTGLTSARYEMVVAVMAKGDAVRSAVISENSPVHHSGKCELEDWQSAHRE